MGSNPLVVSELSKIATESIKVFGDYMKCREVEITERTRIRATLTAINKKIEAEKEIFLRFIESSFADREKLYQRADIVLKTAVENGDVEMVRVTLNYLAVVSSRNPLEGFNQVDMLSHGMKSLV
ncbi:hypothetical protein [Neobacillus sp. D3-1R]|uniref:hypothetical protein n=1 Tax=Neobacillus sp. D3-1R TaxID=3445778 RepID=UPI003FA0D601